MNPPTMGHARLINTMLKKAHTNGAKPFIVVTLTQNRNKNPLSPAQKVEILKMMYPNVNVIASSKPVEFINKLRANGYNNIQMALGSNRVNSFKWINVPKISGGQRNSGSGNVSGISATKARLAARTGTLNNFRRFMSPRVNSAAIMKLIKNVVPNAGRSVKRTRTNNNGSPTRTTKKTRGKK